MNVDQQKVYDAIMEGGQNVFLTGEAGCGKTFLIHKLTTDLYAQNKSIAITAMTNTAKENLNLKNATTFHSLLGVGIDGDIELKDLLARKNVVGSLTTLHEYDVVFIDEVSMIHPRFMDNAILLFYISQIMHEEQTFTIPLVSEVIQYAEATPLRTQIILSGDLYQIPPISKEEEDSGMPQYFTQSTLIHLWRLKQYTLTIQQRQATDEAFSQILRQIRLNNMQDPQVRQFFEQKFLESKKKKLDNSSKKAVQIFNRHRPRLAYLKRLHTGKKEAEFAPYVVFSENCTNEMQQQGFAARKKIKLSPFVKGERVLVSRKIQMFPDSPVLAQKGEMATLIDFTTKASLNPQDTTLIILSATLCMEEDKRIIQTSCIPEKTFGWRFDFRKNKYIQSVMYTIYYPPVINAEAMTAHSVQGWTVPAITLHYHRDLFVAGQLYVALSRAPSAKAVDIVFERGSTVSDLIENQESIQYNDEAMVALAFQDNKDTRALKRKWTEEDNSLLAQCLEEGTKTKLDEIITIMKSHLPIVVLRNLARMKHDFEYFHLRSQIDIILQEASIPTASKKGVLCPSCHCFLDASHFLNLGCYCLCESVTESKLVDLLLKYYCNVSYIVQPLQSKPKDDDLILYKGEFTVTNRQLKDGFHHNTHLIRLVLP